MTIAWISLTEGSIWGGGSSGGSVTGLSLNAGEFVLGAADYMMPGGGSSIVTGHILRNDPTGDRSFPYETALQDVSNKRVQFGIIKADSTGTGREEWWAVSPALGAPDAFRGLAIKLSGVLDGADPIDAVAKGGTGAGTTTLNITTTVPNCAIFAMCYSPTQDPTLPGGSPFTLVTLSNYSTFGNGAFLADAGAAGVKTISFECGFGATGEIVAIALKPEDGSTLVKKWNVKARAEEAADAVASHIIIFDEDGFTAIDHAADVTADSTGLWQFNVSSGNLGLAVGTERLVGVHAWPGTFDDPFKGAFARAIVIEE